MTGTTSTQESTIVAATTESGRSGDTFLPCKYAQHPGGGVHHRQVMHTGAAHQLPRHQG
jgi:hypothetical protein